MKENKKPEDFMPEVSNEQILRNLSFWMTLALQRGAVLDWNFANSQEPPIVDLDDVPLPSQDS